MFPRKIILLLTFIGLCRILPAQTFEWINSQGGSRNDACLNIINGNNGYIALDMFSDTVNINGNKYIPKVNGFQAFYWLFYNNYGTVRKVTKIDQDSVYKRNAKMLDNGRIFLTLDYSFFDSFYVNGININTKKAFPIIEIDTLGRTKVFAQIQVLDNGQPFRPTIHIESDGKDIICIFRVPPANVVRLNNDTIHGSDSGYCIVKFDSNGNILKYRVLSMGLYPWALEKCASGYFRVLSNFRDPSDSFYYNSIKWRYDDKNNTFTYLLDSNLNISSFFRLPGGNFNSRSIAVFGKQSFYYNADYFIDKSNDTVVIGNTHIPVTAGRNTFVVFYTNGKMKYFKKFKIANSQTSNSLQGIMFYKHRDYCVLGGQIINPLLVLPDSIVISNGQNDGNIFGLKLDTFGNIIWYFVGYSTNSLDWFSDLYYDDRGTLFGGYYSNTIKIDSSSRTSKGKYDALLLKITDNSIIRGDVKKGPYCAGDSIIIPYRAYGIYNDTNTFFAELSDEFGNFYGTPRVLGSLKSKKSGTILGTLPLFDVVSSGKYRIRIRSISPFVQSLMRYDSLHLLVYSKDKASPGPDTTICYGNQVKVTAKGGTLWHWSPGTAVLDSTARVTTFVRKQTTKLKIMIADSSGCGMPDTAYKTITVIPPPSVLNGDTVVCVNTPIKLVAYSKDGYRPGIQHYWYQDTTLIAKDTLNTILNSDTVFTIVADDGCSTVKGIATIHLTLPPNPKISVNDTQVCAGRIFTLIGKTQTPSKMSVQYQWYYGNLKVISDTFRQVTNADTSVLLLAHDLCSLKNDTAKINIRVFSPPHLNYSLDSQCAIKSHRLHIYAGGGMGPYQYFIGSQKVDSIIDIATKWSQFAMVSISDQCGRKSDTTAIKLLQIPHANMQITPAVTGCKPLTLSFRTNNSNAAQIEWKNVTKDASLGGNDSVKVTFTESGAFVIRVVYINEVCRDSLSQSITVNPSPIADFEPTRTDYLISEKQSLLINKSQMANKYTWFWQQYSRTQYKLDSFVLNYSDTGSIGVRLVAYNSYGCTDTAIRYIHVHPESIIWLPNAITVNNDGLNDIWYPQGVGIKTFRLIILNRWGQDVFRGKDDEPWVTDHDILPGLYVYRCLYTNWTGKLFEKKGTVLVIK